MAAFNRAMRYVHQKRTYKPEMLVDEPILNLMRETATAYSEPLRQISIEREVPEKLTNALEQNTFTFSGFKTHHQIEEASRLLKDSDGGFKTFNQYLKDVQTINELYNRNYLQAEYNFATASTQMAVNWSEWEKDGDEYNLQYRTAGDDRVREEHAALEGITLPPSDKFWDYYLPPNGWNCRCTAVQVLKDKYPQSDSKRAMAAADGIADTPKKQIFKFNPGKSMNVFPPKHPYLPKGCGDCDKTLLAYNPNSEQCRACKAIKKCIEREPMLVPETVKTYKNGGQIDVYKTIDRTTKDYERIYDTADYFAKQGKKVTLTPKFDSPINCYDYERIYDKLIGTKYYGKCPDILVDDVFYEHEGFISKNSKRALHNMLKHGLKQSDRIVIENPHLTDKYITDRINDRITKGENITEVWIKDGKKLRLMYKKKTP